MRIDRDGMNVRRAPFFGDERLAEQRQAEALDPEPREPRGGKPVFGRDRFVPTSSEGDSSRPGASQHGPLGRPGHGGMRPGQARDADGFGPRGPGGRPMPPEGMGRPETPNRGAQPEEMFALADQDGDGMLSQEEFAAAMMPPPGNAQAPHGGFPGLRPRPEARNSEQELLAYFDQAADARTSESAPPSPLDPVAAPAEDAVTAARADSAVPSDPSGVQDMLLKQLEEVLQDSSLTETDRRYLLEMGSAVAMLDPEAPDFALQLEAILADPAEA